MQVYNCLRSVTAVYSFHYTQGHGDHVSQHGEYVGLQLGTPFPVRTAGFWTGSLINMQGFHPKNNNF